jgi:SNF2 family DNA or RNA helicase
LGKTLQAIAALCYVWETAPDTKAIVLTTKSATPQWAGEFETFTKGVRVIVCAGTARKREKAREAFVASKGPTVMIVGYGSIRRDMSAIQEWAGYILITDEATAYKNPKTQIHQVCRHMSHQADRTWALTATMIKNHLMEGYGIFQVVVPGLFQMTANKFMLYYCLCRMQPIPRSNRQIPVIVGYTPEKIQEFKDAIAPYFLGRPKHEVASDLPALMMKTVEVGLSGAQQDKYDEALEGLLEMGRGEDAILKETTKLTQIIYCQEIVNHLDLIHCDGPSQKLESLLEMLTEGDLAEENVIVYTRFSKMVDILMPVLRKAKIPATRITGDEKMPARKAAMEAFQDPRDETRVVCITMAAGDAINLQSAKAIIFYDTPWSAGDFIQIVGRMIRIGSIHDRCYAIHLVARGKKNTVDTRVIEVMHRKMKLIEAVIGRRLKGEQDIGAMIPVENDISDLFDMLSADAREAA